MVNAQILANILKFMERPPQGIEAYAWVEAHQAVQNEINNLIREQLTPPKTED